MIQRLDVDELFDHEGGIPKIAMGWFGAMPSHYHFMCDVWDFVWPRGGLIPKIAMGWRGAMPSRGGILSEYSMQQKLNHWAKIPRLTAIYFGYNQ